MRAWEQVSQALSTQPLFSMELAGDTPLQLERYFYHAHTVQSPPMDCAVLAVLLGGNRLRGGIEEQTLLSVLPGTSVFIVPGTGCQWEFMGAIDFAAFYFFDEHAAQLQRLMQSQAASARGFVAFNDPLINQVALQLVEEAARGADADRLFVNQLRGVMLEQLGRVMEGSAGHYIRVNGLQLGRLTRLLDWIQHNLHQPLGSAVLAERLGVSESHFRRVFQEAMRCPPHRYIMQLRLKRVSQLLTGTTLSIARIASECGFESQSHMTASFSNTYGLPPARMRRESLAKTIK